MQFTHYLKSFLAFVFGSFLTSLLLVLIYAIRKGNELDSFMLLPLTFWALFRYGCFEFVGFLIARKNQSAVVSNSIDLESTNAKTTILSFGLGIFDTLFALLSAWIIMLFIEWNKLRLSEILIAIFLAAIVIPCVVEFLLMQRLVKRKLLNVESIKPD